MDRGGIVDAKADVASLESPGDAFTLRAANDELVIRVGN